MSGVLRMRAPGLADAIKVAKGQRGRRDLDYVAIRQAERHLAEPGESSYGRMVNDQQVRSRVREVGASATPGSRINQALGGASRAADKLLTCAL